MNDVIAHNYPVYMFRPHLEGLPVYAVPAGFLLRWYQAGDEDHWVAIHVAADRYNRITHELFWREFGSAREELPVRQCYLCTADYTPIGTASAWFDPVADDVVIGCDNVNSVRWGRVHWVALHPAYHGRGLAKPLLSAVCQRLRELGHQRARLATSTARIPAINLYRHFGFEPEIVKPEDEAIWQQLAPALKPMPGRLEPG